MSIYMARTSSAVLNKAERRVASIISYPLPAVLLYTSAKSSDLQPLGKPKGNKKTFQYSEKTTTEGGISDRRCIRCE